MERRLLGKRINQIRKERGLTSEALSEICDVNAGHIRQIESGDQASKSASVYQNMSGIKNSTK